MLAILIIILVLALVGGAIMGIIELNSRKRIRKIYEENFCMYCRTHGIYKLKTDKEIELAYQIAAQQKIKQSRKYLNRLLEKDFAAQQAKIDLETRDKQAKERKEYKKLTCFSEYSGQEKRIAMLKVELAKAKSAENTLTSGTKSLVGATQQREQDWGGLAGLAEGIAGPAAGVVTAINIQANNAAIRAQNDANIRAIAPAIGKTYAAAAKYSKNAAALQKEIALTSAKPVSQTSARVCLEYLSFSGTYVRVSETGTCSVFTDVKAIKPIEFYNDPDAIIDGTIIARILDGEKEIGTALLVLPLYGISYNESIKLKGMCLFCGTQGKHYNVTFDAKNLWIMKR